MNVEKRKRGFNFFEDECIILLKLIKPYQHAVECKKTDNYSVGKKDILWKKITAAFNEISTKLLRNQSELRKKYENMKRVLRRKLVNGADINDLAPWEHTLLSILNSNEEFKIKYGYEVDNEEEGKVQIADDGLDEAAYVLINSAENNSNIEVIDYKDIWVNGAEEELPSSPEPIPVSPREPQRRTFRNITESSSSEHLMKAKMEQIRLENLYRKELVEEIRHKRRKRDLKMDILRVELEKSKIELEMMRRKLLAETEKINDAR